LTEQTTARTNRLIHSTSPYLLQHAHNPVDWHPWGEEALRRARAEDKPILLSIGYSACHWCHVMERESFEDESIAALMNRNFIPVKVDREERPDLDDVYMAATLAMNDGQGGWPMTVFLTPDQEPFFAGTYFPPTDRYGRPGFATVLSHIAELWARDREGLRSQASRLADYIRQGARPGPAVAVGEEELRSALSQLKRDFDPRWGGFGAAPKFPPSTALSLLLRAHRRFSDHAALDMVAKTLDAMARGGIYDQLGGGFHRYSVDDRWLVPHFEKMLYDNALLAKVYLEGHQATGNAFHGRIAAETLDYVLREMTSPEGGFYSATDADSEGEEGKFFVWTPDEVAQVLGADEARRFSAYYDVTEQGNWEGKSILHAPRADATAAEPGPGLDPAELERSLAASRSRLYEARRRRVAPGLDDKVLTAWNGLMIGALAEGHRVLGEPRYLAAAVRAADFVLATLGRPDGHLLRTFRAGTAHLNGYLEDYAYLAEGLLDLYEAGAGARYLRQAERLAALMLADFGDEGGGFYQTAHGHEALIVRHREGHDGAMPNANATAAHVLARLSFHLDREDLRERSAEAIRAYGRAIARVPRSFAKSLAVVDLLLEGPVELAYVGRPGAEDLEALQRAVARHHLPNRIVAHLDPGSEDPGLPLLAGKGLVQARAALYVCRGFTCGRPVTDPAAVADVLSGGGVPSAGERRSLAAASLAGTATPEGTAAYAARFAPAAPSGHTALGSTGLVVSRIGFGGYRVDDETPEHREALSRALLGGCNLVDTSTNYTDGGSERLVGETLSRLVRSGALRREEVVVVSKIGYVQGHNLELAKEREAAGRPFPEMVKYGEDVWHCVHPDFLEDQLRRSLERSRLAALDVCLLHNPEYFLSDAHERSHGKLEGRRKEFYGRLRDSFAFLEAQVAAGRLRWYGVSSNTCTRPADDPEATSLTRMLESAREGAGAGHHLRVLQLPLNLLEPAALLVRNTGPEGDRTVLEAAAEAGLGVLVNRPLNAMAGEGLLRLASVAVSPTGADLDGQLAILAGIEAEYRRDIAPSLSATKGGLPPEHFFRWSAELRGIAPHVRGLEHWGALETQRILPRLMEAVHALDRGLEGGLADRWEAWRARYLPELQKAFGELRRRAAERSAAAVAAVTEALDRRLPEQRRGESLSRKALWVAAGTPGVSSVLNGMRAPAYVDDALEILAWAPVPAAQEVYEALRDASPPEPSKLAE